MHSLILVGLKGSWMVLCQKLKLVVCKQVNCSDLRLIYGFARAFNGGGLFEGGIPLTCDRIFTALFLLAVRMHSTLPPHQVESDEERPL